MISPYIPAEVSVSADTTLQDFVADTFWPMKESLRASTKKSYRRDLARILPALGHLKLKDVRHLAIQYLMNESSTTKMAQTSRETLSAVLTLACSLEILQVNPASDRFIFPDKIPGDKAFDQGVVLTTFTEIHEYLRALKRTVPNSPLERGSLLGLGIGLRKGEIFGVNGSSIDLSNHTLGVFQTYVEADGGGFILLPPKTPESIRQAPLLGYVAGRISELGFSNGPFVVNSSGTRQNPETASKSLLKWRRKNNLPDVTFGSMRHSFATSCISAGIPIADVSVWLGHSNPNITYESYVRPSLVNLQEDARKIDRYFNINRRRRIATTVDWTQEAEDFINQLIAS